MVRPAPDHLRQITMNILLVDDHPLFREGVGLLLKQSDPSIQTAFASTIAEAVSQAQLHRKFDLILLDLGLPEGGGVAGLERVRGAFEHVPVVMLSAANDPWIILECLDRGAMGFLTKSSSTELFRAALNLVVLGNVYIPPEALSAMAATQSISSPELMSLPPFTPRETAVLDALIEGQSNKLIARRLNIAEQTVKFHVSNILKVLKVHNRTQAVIAAARMGFKISWRGSNTDEGNAANRPSGAEFEGV